MIQKTTGWILTLVLFVLTSCASKKTLVAEKNTKTSASTKELGQTPQQQATVSKELQMLSFVQKVYENQLYIENIVAKLSFSLENGAQKISAQGALRMRKDKVIRLQAFIPLLGSEVGRIEFTPDYVLVLNRMQKQYIKTSYQKIAFLRDNGLDFYSLQALFWNHLLVPGQQKVSKADLKHFAVGLQTKASVIPVTLNSNHLSCQWNTNPTTAQILSAVVSYANAQNGKSTLTWNYQDFHAIGVKYYPAKHTIVLNTSIKGQPKQVKVHLEMSDLATDSHWEECTVVSERYQQIDENSILNKLLQF